MAGTIRAEIGEGVSVVGPESLIREAMGVPSDVFDVPAFLRSLASSAGDEVRFDAVDALLGDHEPAYEPEAQPWDAPRFAPGIRVWDVGTENGPWVLVKSAALTIPAELPPFDHYDPNYYVPAYREIAVDAWVVETSPWQFEIVPEACLTDEPPQLLSDEVLLTLEQEAAVEAVADLAELSPEHVATLGMGGELVRIRSEVHTYRDEIRKMRTRWAVGALLALLAAGATFSAAMWWVAQNIR